MIHGLTKSHVYKPIFISNEIKKKIYLEVFEIVDLFYTRAQT